MPTLQFKGKNIIWNHHLSVPYHSLDEVEELHFQAEKSTNLIVGGDNLMAARELVVQVYQFSVMYCKSMHHKNLPVIVKYPEMVAQIAPHFEGNDIPYYGKKNLWFL